MLGKRMRRFRLARGMSLDNLEAAIGGLVSKQTLSKYERGQIRPKVRPLNRIAAALGVKSVQLWGEPVCDVEFVAYRKRARLSKKEQERIESFVAEVLERRVRLQQRMDERNILEFPIQAIPVHELDGAEQAAFALRQKWDLGIGPIANLVDVLENRFIHIIEVDASETFDGISAVARDSDGNVLAVAIATRRGTSGARHRLNLAHELGLMTLKLSEDVDVEKMAFRFGAAFLAPAEELRQEVGEQRNRIETDELLYLKWCYGMSIQVILLRLRDLGIITESYYEQWCMNINRLGWRKQEPIEISPEKPKRFRLKVYRALAEELIGEQEGEQLLNDTVESTAPQSVTKRRAFLALPKEVRGHILRKQAEQMVEHYERDTEWRELGGGDIVEY